MSGEKLVKKQLKKLKKNQAKVKKIKIHNKIPNSLNSLIEKAKKRIFKEFKNSSN